MSNGAVSIAGSPWAAQRFRLAAYCDFAKPRITLLVLVVTAAGFILAAPSRPLFDLIIALGHTLLGTGLVAIGAHSLNQLLEARWDALMERTRNRPLPSGRISKGEALRFGVSTALFGVVYLAVLVNVPTSLLAAFCFASYVFAYTPLKRVTRMSVYVGAIPGALPPVIGWAGASGSIELSAWVLFAILFCWQLPHFATIAWLYRKDYARAGYRLVEESAERSRLADAELVIQALVLLAASLVPVVQDEIGSLYAFLGILLGITFLGATLLFVKEKSERRARLHILASVTYVPLLFVAMLIDRIGTSA